MLVLRSIALPMPETIDALHCIYERRLGRMILITIGTWYLYAGGAVAVWFIPFGIGRLDENAEGAWIFRPLLIPGVLLIWPLILWRCVVLRNGEERLDRHTMPRIRQERATLVFACAVPLIILLALSVRQDPDALPGPVLLEPAE